MARRFGRNLENPERRIENEGNFSDERQERPEKQEKSLGNPYDDNFDKKLDVIDPDEREHHEEASKKEKFMQSVKVELQKTDTPDTPLSLAYQKLKIARQSGDREAIINAEDSILDLERKEEEKEYNLRIAEFREKLKIARQANDTQSLKKLKEERKSFFNEMKYDELNYKIKKLQNSQRLNPSREKLKEIMELKKELEELDMEEISR